MSVDNKLILVTKFFKEQQKIYHYTLSNFDTSKYKDAIIDNYITLKHTLNIIYINTRFISDYKYINDLMTQVYMVQDLLDGYMSNTLTKYNSILTIIDMINMKYISTRPISYYNSLRSIDVKDKYFNFILNDVDILTYIDKHRRYRSIDRFKLAKLLTRILFNVNLLSKKLKNKNKYDDTFIDVYEFNNYMYGLINIIYKNKETIDKYIEDRKKRYLKSQSFIVAQLD